MKIKYSVRLFLITAAAGFTISSQHIAFADDTSNWLQSLFGSSESQTNNNTAPDQKQIQADQAAAQQFQQAALQDSQALRQDYQKLRQDQRAGVDTTADLQAIRNHRASLENNTAHQQQNAIDLTKDGIPNTYTVPVNTHQNINGVDHRWDNRAAYVGQNNYGRRWDNNPRRDFHGRDQDYRHHRYNPNWANNQQV